MLHRDIRVGISGKANPGIAAVRGGINRERVGTAGGITMQEKPKAKVNDDIPGVIIGGVPGKIRKDVGITPRDAGIITKGARVGNGTIMATINP